MTEKNKYYFDTNVLWKYYYPEQGSTAVKQIVDRNEVLVSPLTVLKLF